MTRSTWRWSGSGASAFALLTLAACGRHSLGRGGGDASANAPRDAGVDVSSVSGGDAAADVPGASGGDATTDEQGADLPGDDVGVDAPGVVLFDNCSSPLPGSYMTRCSGCHTQRGPANPRYPDLYAFKGTEADFSRAVRDGGPEMAPLPPSVISDGDIAAIHHYFTMVPRQSLETIDLGAIVPLFLSADAKNPPIVFKRDDGAIVTRGAGRFRGRHEKEGSFGLYLENAFLEPDGYAFTFEDFTPVGQQRIRVTYLASYAPFTDGSRQTNFRHWKAQGNNATFMLNDYLVSVAPPPPVPATAPFVGVQQFDEMKVPAGRSMTVGENYEIELGVFLPQGLPRRDTFYSDTIRYRIGVGGLTPNNRDYDVLAGPLLGAQLGGDTTIGWLVAEPYMYFEQMALDIQQENLQSFLDGRRLFYTDFTTGAHLEPGNSAFPEQAGKAGPLSNARSCESCHFRNGSGSWVDPLSGNTPVGAKASLQAQEGTVTVTGTDTKTVTLADGTSVSLHRPTLAVVANGAGVTRFSARVARPLVGLGLLEALDERTLLVLSDRLDCDKNAISGRPSYVKDPLTGELRVGRLGWKAEKVSVAHQVAADASARLGVTTSLLPDALGRAELSDADVARLTTYMRLIGVPPQRNADDPQVRSGARLFQIIGCAMCHRTDLLTSSTHPFSELRAQAVRPYTDLLLHDMGPDLADDSGVPVASGPTAPASASEWRTPPLWGVGLAKTVNPEATFLHDGRAADLQEAILWHGGEAEKIKFAYVALSAADRAALLAFVQSL